jgi:LysR family glycine cleavage system transcriptional activator
MQKLPPLAAIRAFEAAARHLSFTRAAEELGMTQAAVSYQIRMLEERLGAPLFVRLARHVELTATGRELAPAVGDAFAQLRTAFEAVGRLQDRRLTLSVLPTVAAHWLVPRLGRFQAAHPELAVYVDASNDLADFARGEIDLAIRSGSGRWQDLEAHLLLPSHFTAVAGPALLTERRPQRPVDLLDLPLLGASDPWWPEWFAAAGVPGVDLRRPGTSLGTQQFEAMAAMTGQGVALVNPYLFAGDLAAGRLARLPESPPPLGQDPRLPGLGPRGSGPGRSGAAAEPRRGGCAAGPGRRVSLRARAARRPFDFALALGDIAAVEPLIPQPRQSRSPSGPSSLSSRSP